MLWKRHKRSKNNSSSIAKNREFVSDKPLPSIPTTSLLDPLRVRRDHLQTRLQELENLQKEYLETELDVIFYFYDQIPKLQKRIEQEMTKLQEEHENEKRRREEQDAEGEVIEDINPVTDDQKPEIEKESDVAIEEPRKQLGYDLKALILKSINRSSSK